ncbi:ABC transporter substrate-binding protein [Aeromonas sobria]|uniref:ABC transporter substrate-binding protein n=1 Tax=Aeromonas sobria TaxID=646 RepID=A0A2N3J7P9_AERSO|nr:transporter substrate-binding domain-containing protein [Aeromonas sobria]PKQ82602.1 ABC transporter substrate-binding protein [Aeromonas sobria]
MRWVVLLWWLLSLSLSAQPGLTLLSHDLPPFTEYRDGKLDGFAIRLIDEVQQELGTRYPIRMYPLKRALAMARVEPGYGVFVVQRIPEREPHFKWVGPLFINRVFIYQAPGNSHPLTSLAQLRDLPRVGVVLGNADDVRLSKEGYRNLVRYQTVGEAIDRLMLGKIDALPMAEMVMDATLDKLGLSRRSVVSSGVLLHQSGLYIAFSKGMDDREITRWQQAVDAVRVAQGRADGPTHDE